jgi:hypothetical protein
MEPPLLLPESEYPKDKPLTKVVSMQPVTKKVADTHPSENEKPNEKKELSLFSTEDIFKARRFELL